MPFPEQRGALASRAVGVYAELLDPSGAAVRGLRDPAGGTFDGAGDFDRLLGDHAALPVWASIDAYGDTTLPSQQVLALLAELPVVIEQAADGPEHRGLARLVVMAQACQFDPALTLRFVGD